METTRQLKIAHVVVASELAGAQHVSLDILSSIKNNNIKKKNKKFLDKHNKVNKEKKDIPATALAWHKEFLEYITENRLIDLFAKRGKIERMDQIGDYIRWMIEDAKEDFLKDHTAYDKAFDKVVFNSAGGKVVAMLKGHM